jgi:4-amino-4-deoxy-L-arabinose transferase-like glycosyltransferase
VARAAALGGFVALALLPVSSLAVYADANPANHGHHYGQLKHHHGAPPPPPPPVTAPPVTAPPVIAPPATAPAPGGSHNPGPGTSPAITSVAPSLAAVRIVLPPVPSGEVNLVRSVPPSDQNVWWLLLILVVSLAVLWLFAVLQLTRAGLKRRWSQATA